MGVEKIGVMNAGRCYLRLLPQIGCGGRCRSNSDSGSVSFRELQRVHPGGEWFALENSFGWFLLTSKIDSLGALWHAFSEPAAQSLNACQIAQIGKVAANRKASTGYVQHNQAISGIVRNTPTANTGAPRRPILLRANPSNMAVGPKKMMKATSYQWGGSNMLFGVAACS